MKSLISNMKKTYIQQIVKEINLVTNRSTPILIYGENIDKGSCLSGLARGLEVNPNGSCLNIAGISNANKNVFGMMPHPERAVDLLLNNTDGKLIFESLLN